MKNPKWPSNAGADRWNVCVCHNDILVLVFWLDLLEQISQSSPAASARQCMITHLAPLSTLSVGKGPKALVTPAEFCCRRQILKRQKDRCG